MRKALKCKRAYFAGPGMIAVVRWRDAEEADEHEARFGPRVPGRYVPGGVERWPLAGTPQSHRGCTITTHAAPARSWVWARLIQHAVRLADDPSIAERYAQR